MDVLDILKLHYDEDIEFVERVLGLGFTELSEYRHRTGFPDEVVDAWRALEGSAYVLPPEAPCDVPVGLVFELGSWKGHSLSWRVLEARPEGALCVCESVVGESTWYDSSRNSWAGSDVRPWLKYGFAREAFSSDELPFILETQVLNLMVPNIGYHDGKLRKPQKPTADKVFVLSYDETLRLFPDWRDRAARTLNGERACWWMRTPSLPYGGRYVDEDGRLCTSRPDVEYGIRPAMVVDAGFLSEKCGRSCG